MHAPYIPSVGEMIIGVLLLGLSVGAIIAVSVSMWRSVREHKAQFEHEGVTKPYVEERLEGLRVAIVNDVKAAYSPEHYGK